MRFLAPWCSALFVFAASLLFFASPARAELQFCNLTGTDSQVIEGHRTGGHDGLVVNGTFIVRKGKCGVIVPGRLSARRYYLHIQENHDSYGGASRLCVYNLYHFTITNEDAPDFRCSGSVTPSNVHMPGFTNVSMHLAGFMAVDSNGEATIVVTQRKDTTIHFVLK